MEIKRHGIYFAIVLMLGSAVFDCAQASPPPGFEGRVLELVRSGKLVSSTPKDTDFDYELHLKTFLKKVSAKKFLDLVAATDEFHHLVPDIISDSTASQLIDSASQRYGYKLDIVVHYHWIPYTLHSKVTREISKNGSEATVRYKYTIRDFEDYMEPLSETTRVLVDSEHPEDGVYIEDVIKIHLKQRISNIKLLKSELSKTYSEMISAFKARLAN